MLRQTGRTRTATADPDASANGPAKAVGIGNALLLHYARQAIASLDRTCAGLAGCPRSEREGSPYRPGTPDGRPILSRPNRRGRGSSCFARNDLRYPAPAGFHPRVPADSPPQTPRQTRKNARRAHLREGTESRGQKPQDTASSNGHRFDQTLRFGTAGRKRHPLGRTRCLDSPPTRAGVQKSQVHEHDGRMRSLSRRHPIRTNKNHHADVFAQ